MTDWQELVDWMHQPEVQAAVARHAEPQPEAEEQGEPVQAAQSDQMEGI